MLSPKFGRLIDRRPLVVLCPRGLAIAFVAHVLLFLYAVLMPLTHDHRCYLIAAAAYMALACILLTKLVRGRQKRASGREAQPRPPRGPDDRHHRSNRQGGRRNRAPAVTDRSEETTVPEGPAQPRLR